MNRRLLLLSGTLAPLVLAILLAYTAARFFVWPYAGFVFPSDGVVYRTCAPEDDRIRPGDQIVQFDGIRWEDFRAQWRVPLFSGYRPGNGVELVVLRDGKELPVSWTYRGASTCELVGRLLGDWWLGYVFWFAGMMSWLLIRPMDRQWWLLQGFFYLTALWLSTGSDSWRHIWFAPYVFRAFFWLALPVYLWLHWEFPTPLGVLPRPALWGIWGLATVLIAGEWARLWSETLFAGGFAIVAICIVGMFLWRLLFRREERTAALILLGAFSATLGVPVLALLLNAFGLDTPNDAALLLTFPAIPSAYFYVMFREQFPELRRRSRSLFLVYSGILLVGGIALSTLPELPILNPASFSGQIVVWSVLSITVAIISLAGFAPLFFMASLAGSQYRMGDNQTGRFTVRANRLLAPYLFVVTLLLLLVSTTALAAPVAASPGALLFVALGQGLLGAILVALFYGPFRRLIDRRLLGVRIDPEEIVRTFAERITTSNNRRHLVNVLEEEMLPSLLVRQWQFLAIDREVSAGDAHVLASIGIAPAETPSAVVLEQWGAIAQNAPREPLPQRAATPSWIRLALPLVLENQLLGFWLFGQRDPDDVYLQLEVQTLRSLADQTAIALANITQSENLQRLHHANIDRHEAERGRLARELHDEVLNRLAGMLMLLDESAATPQFDAAYQALTTSVRHTISGLRPAMLAYGLPAALEELVDDLRVRRPGVNLVLDCALQEAFERYPPRVEEYVFRIVQQAVENAIQHANAQTIQITGECVPNRIRLAVTDDGSGFDDRTARDLSELLANRHYGLVGMYERAELIQATLTVNSAPGRGTVIAVNWSPRPSA